MGLPRGMTRRASADNATAMLADHWCLPKVGTEVQVRLVTDTTRHARVVDYLFDSTGPRLVVLAGGPEVIPWHAVVSITEEASS